MRKLLSIIFAILPCLAGASVLRDNPTSTKPRLNVIVLDAGHGGKDSGAVGPGGFMEKQAALGIVLKLGALIQKELPGTKVVYTRHDDHFVELYRRGEIANAAHGRLFISVHCNSTPEKPSNATGFTTYFLRPGKTEAAIHVAARENAVIKYEAGHHQYQNLSDVDYILTSMSRNQDVKFSEKFASLVQQELSKKLPIPDNGVSQAGFLVLIGAAMPNVLIETGFISDPKDEAILKSQSGEMKYAEGILAAIKRYKAIYERS